MSSHNVIDSSVVDTIEARLSHVEARLLKVESKVLSLESWMARPCLHTALETTFKKKMNTLRSNRSGFFKLLSGSVESEVLEKTGITKDAWINMESFLNGRNEIIHHKVPDNVLVEDCYISLIGTMDESTRLNFSSFLKIVV